ncbi:MAG: GNAT family N-acetyltransferase [Cyclobacteriaceae bacterium]|nr:GNAT family N-acetyltransferase [Cyclobacteriaceae bacterium]
MTDRLYRNRIDNWDFKPAATYLYNSPAHLQLQASRGWTTFELLDEKSEQVQARISFYIRAHAAASPLKAPFGSCEVYARISQTRIKHFFLYIEATLRQRGVKQITIKSYPVKYHPAFSNMLDAVLRSRDFTRIEEVSSVIEVNRQPLSKRMKISERQKLVKAQRSFVFRQLDIQSLSRVYRFIAGCRREKGHALSMSLGQLRKTSAALPGKFMLFEVANDAERAAAAIVIQVSHTTWYTFYYAHASKFNKISPVVHLLAGIYRSAQAQKVKRIDLGTSMLGEKVNKSLLHFKSGIGAATNAKYTYTKVW